MAQVQGKSKRLPRIVDGIIDVFRAGPSYVIWDPDAAHTMRVKYRIVGAMIGTMPNCPQQNSYHGLPLILAEDEVAHCVSNGFVRIVDESKSYRRPSPGDLDAYETWRAADRDHQRRMAQREAHNKYLNRLQKINIDLYYAKKKEIMEQRQAEEAELQRLRAITTAHAASDSCYASVAPASEQSVQMQSEQDEVEQDAEDESDGGEEFEELEGDQEGEDNEEGEEGQEDVEQDNDEEEDEGEEEEAHESRGRKRKNEEEDEEENDGERQVRSKEEQPSQALTVRGSSSTPAAAASSASKHMEDQRSFSIHVYVRTRADPALVDRVDCTAEFTQTFPRTPMEMLRMTVFSDMHSRGYYLTSAAKFGGHYLAYPGDPLRFHSHFIVHASQYTAPVKVRDIVAFGRLGTAVKKSTVLASRRPVKKENNPDGTKMENVYVTITWQPWKQQK